MISLLETPKSTEVKAPPTDLADFIRLEFGNRVDLGMAAWRKNDGKECGRYLSYSETIATTYLIIRGWSIKDAMQLVYGNLVVAVPHVPGHMSGEASASGFVYLVGYIRLADGSIWEILGDIDLDHAKDIIEESDCHFEAIATRNLLPSDEPLGVRVSHMVSAVRRGFDGKFSLLSETELVWPLLCDKLIGPAA